MRKYFHFALGEVWYHSGTYPANALERHVWLCWPLPQPQVSNVC
jgi:hypothetical protein